MPLFGVTVSGNSIGYCICDFHTTLSCENRTLQYPILLSETTLQGMFGPRRFLHVHLSEVRIWFPGIGAWVMLCKMGRGWCLCIGVRHWKAERKAFSFWLEGRAAASLRFYVACSSLWAWFYHSICLLGFELRLAFRNAWTFPEELKQPT